MRRIATLLGTVWALPCSFVGGLLALPVLLAGGKAQRVGPAIEVWLHEAEPPRGSRAARLRFAAITLGNVIVGVSRPELERLRSHEQVHVRQYQCLGPLFFVAYPLASLLAIARGQCAHRGNVFEVQAFRHSARSANAV